MKKNKESPRTGLEREFFMHGLEITIKQAGPLEFIAVVQTKDKEEIARSADYHMTPVNALTSAIDGIQKGQANIPALLNARKKQ